ncbi:HNH endonuclease [Qipengyuania flava]|nr:HNH endonuclease [Qipengyuania flava]
MVEGVRPSCWPCERPLGRRVQQHHPVPKAKKGREIVPVHPICHRAIHANFTNAQLARIGADRGVLLADGALARFVEWVADKPPDFHAPTRKPR